jgi:hypothetical protein
MHNGLTGEEKSEMQFTRIGSKITRALLLAATMLVLSVATAAAHTQTVTPNGEGFTKPISKAWAQAHCNAQSPAIVADASGGVVQFLPAAALPCPTVANPGGQIHP